MALLLVPSGVLFSAFNHPATATAAPSTYLNFQARLLQSSGNLVPDGTYNIEFKLYKSSGSGASSQGVCVGGVTDDCEWVETRTSGNKVNVVNGYLSVNLGSVTAFGGSIDWTQQQWLTMNIGGVGSPSWDGEMTPRIQLTSVPLAFVANNVASGSTNASSTNSGNISIQSGNAAGATSNSGNISLDVGTATGTTGTISLGASNASALTLGRSGLTTNNAGNLTVTGGTLTAGTSSQAGSLVISDGSSNTGSIILQATSGNYNFTIPTDTANDTFCLVNLNNCTGTGAISVGTIDGNTYSANGGSIAAGVLYLQAATGSHVGLVTTSAQTFGGDKTFNGNVILAASQSLTVTGGNTASRPGSPTEGMVYYDTTTKQLITYENGKWQGDRAAASRIVAASNSSQTAKDDADYVGDGETSSGSGVGTIDGDQIQINSALSAVSSAGGGTVYLMEGTYTVDASISIPNNVTLAGSGNSTLIQFGNFGSTSTTFDAITNTDQTTGTGVSIRDLKIDGRKSINTAGTQDGIYFLNMGSLTRAGANITNVIVSNFLTYGAYIDTSSNNSITNNTFQNNGSAGIRLRTASNNSITGNNSIGNGAYGFYLSTSSTNNTLSGNTADANTTANFYILTSTGNAITGNTSNNSTYAIVLTTTANNNIVSGNSATGNSFGITLTSSNNNNISGNKIHNTGGSTTNNGIYIDTSDANSVTSNDITDTGCSTNCYAINVLNSASDNNYLGDNTFTTSSGTATINDAGTGTRYAGQSVSQNGLDILFKQTSSATAFSIQNASGASVFAVDTSANLVSFGDAATAGALKISDGSSNTGTILVQATSGNYTFTIPTVTANDTFCLAGLNNCPGAGAASVGTIDGGTYSANGASIASSTLYLQAATGSHVGLVTIGTQSFGGDKTFTGALAVTGDTTLTGDLAINGGDLTTSATTLNLFSSTVTTLTAVQSATTISIGATTGTATIRNPTLMVGNSGASGVRGAGNAGFAVGSIGQSSGSTSSGGTTFLSGTVTGATSNSGTVILQSGNSSTSGNTGTVTIQSGNATSGNSGNLTIDAGTASGTHGTISVGTTSASALTLGRSGVTTSNAGALAITGATSFVHGTDYSTTGSTNDVSISGSSLVRLNGASAQTITGIVAGTDGQLLVLINSASNAATISNNSLSSAAANRIITGTGSDLSMPAGASLTMYYDSQASLWRVTGISSAGGTGVSTVGTLDGGTANATGATISGSTMYLQSASVLYAGLVNTGAQSFAGDKTFTGSILQVSDASTALLLKDSTGTYINLSFDSSNGHLKVYDHGGARSAYADIYYASGTAVFAASTGTTQVGNGTGDITLSLVNNSEKFNFSHSGSNAGSSDIDFYVGRSITGTTNNLQGAIAKIEDLSTFTSGSSAPDVLYVNQNNTSATGNLIVAKTGGSVTQFAVSTGGNVSLAGNLTVASTLLTTDASNNTVALASSNISTSLLTLTNNSATTVTGGVLQVTTNALTTGFAANLSSSSPSISTGGLLALTASGATTATGGILQVTANALSTGFAVNLSSSSSALSTGGLLALTASAATTATGGILQLTANTITTGIGININANALTTGAAIKVTSTKNTATGGLIQVTDTALTTGIGINITAGSTLTSGAALKVTSTGAANGTGGVVQIAAGSLTTTGVALNISANTGVAIHTNSGSTIDLGSSTAGGSATMKISQDATTTACATGVAEGLVFRNTGGTQVGHICINGPSAASNPGKLFYFGQAFNITSTDVAENYSDSSNNLEAGDLVALDQSGNTVKAITKATNANNGQLFGIISSSPGVLLSGISDSDGATDLVNPKPVALSGRVPTKVNNSNGAIQIGDYLTVSSTPGVAAKATGSGMVIGRALESYNGSGTGKIEVLAQNFYYSPSAQDLLQNGDIGDLTSNGTITTNNLTVTGTATIHTLNVTGQATIGTLHVIGDAQFDSNLTVNGITTTKDLTVTGETMVQHITVSAGITLGASTEDPTTTEVAHPISKSFKASKPIAAGSVVVLDVTAGNGWVTTTTTPGSKLVIGIALSDAQHAGDTIQVAIGGTAKVTVQGTPIIGDLLHSDSHEGKASAISNPASGELVGKVIGVVDSNQQVLILVTLQ